MRSWLAQLTANTSFQTRIGNFRLLFFFPRSFENITEFFTLRDEKWKTIDTALGLRNPPPSFKPRDPRRFQGPLPSNEIFPCEAATPFDGSIGVRVALLGLSRGWEGGIEAPNREGCARFSGRGESRAAPAITAWMGLPPLVGGLIFE